MTKFKPLLTLLVGVLSTLGVLSLTHLGPAQAQSPGVNLASLIARLNADEAKIALLQGTPVPGPKGDTGPVGPKGDPGPAGGSLTPDKLAVLNTFSLSGTDLFLSGVNVHIVDGTGSTIRPSDPSGLGNLIIGYNRLRADGTDARTGSHNLILGDQNNYSSSGGLVAGFVNTISGNYASVSGGQRNTASGFAASVSGGDYNTASGLYASVSGGGVNIASGLFASVSGGEFNVASGSFASVSGGYFNIARGDYASVSGGLQNTVSGLYASVSGGQYNTASGDYASVSGGVVNTASGLAASVSGGGFSTASGIAASVSGGVRGTQNHDYGWSGGSYHTP